MSNEALGTGFMRTSSKAESLHRIRELVGMGYITDTWAVLDDGFFFCYTDKGVRFVHSVASECQEVGMSQDDYVDILFALRKEGDSDEPQQMGDGK